MGLEVDFITLGDAAKRLDTPAPTLRLWTDQMEEYKIHHVHRNNRNERMYYASDMQVFTVIRDLRAKYGRRTTTLDVGNMLVEQEEKFGIMLRRGEDAPVAPPSNKMTELLNQEDIKKLMANDRVKAFIAIVIEENNKVMRNDIIEDVQEAVRAEMLESENRTQEKLDRIDNRLRERAEQTDRWFTEMRERDEKKVAEEKASVGWWSRVFGKN